MRGETRARRSALWLMFGAAVAAAMLFLAADGSGHRSVRRSHDVGMAALPFPGLVPGEVERLFEPAFSVEDLEPPTRERPIGTWLLEGTDASIV